MIRAAYPFGVPNRAGPWPTAAGFSIRGRGATYAIAAVATAACLLLEFALQPLLHDRAVFLAFLPAVIGSAVIGGAAPALTVTGLGLLAGWAAAGTAVVHDAETVTAAV